MGPTGVQATIACNRASRQRPPRDGHPTGILQFVLNLPVLLGFLLRPPGLYTETPKSPNHRQQTVSSSRATVGRPRRALASPVLALAPPVAPSAPGLSRRPRSSARSLADAAIRCHRRRRVLHGSSRAAAVLPALNLSLPAAFLSPIGWSDSNISFSASKAC
jgi:hypothetical protein